MSIWGTLGNAALSYMGGSGANAAGQTTAQRILPALIQAGAMTAGNIAEGREKGRATENAQTMSQDSQRQRATEAKNSDVLDRAKLDLAKKQFSQSSETDAFKKALQASLIQNLRDVHLNMPKDVPVFNFEGGLRPSAMGPGAQQAAKLLQQHAMERLMNGEQLDDVGAYQDFNPSEMQKGGALDSILGGIGMAGGVMQNIRAQQGSEEQNSLLKKILAANQSKGPIDVTEQPLPTDFRTPGMFGG